jgi:arylsulfatase A-like enzyme/Flp pilus assembly protein TadD
MRLPSGPALAVVLALAPGCTREPSGKTPPPIVIVSIDTLRADHLPAYGYEAVDTPHIDGLRRDAVLFANAYSHVPLTLPSHASLFTGLLPPRHGVRNNLGYRLDAQAHPTLAALLKTRGFATGAAVSAYVMRRDSGLGDGFDWYEDSLEPLGAGAEAAALVRRSGCETVARALEWTLGLGSRPFLLFVHLYEPHFPYEPPEPFRSRYASAYDGAIAAADQAVGELLEGLRRSGLYQRSAIVLLSDHGEGLGEHGEAEHGLLLYREALHVPLLLKLPGQELAGTLAEGVVGLADVFPTLLRLAGATPPLALDGTDLFQAARRSGVYAETYYPRIHLGWSELRSLLDERHHLIEGGRAELFDLGRDPGERRPLEELGAVGLAMQRALGGLSAPLREAEAVDPAVAERLAALGYLAGGAEREPEGGARADPRDAIAEYEAVRAAFRLVRAGRDAAAVAAFRRLLARSPGLFDAQWELGATLKRLGRPDEAARAFEAAMRLAPSMAARVALSLAEVQLEAGRLEAAAESARLGGAADAARAHALLARVALARGALDDAERECALSARAGVDPEALLARVELRVRRGRLAEALALVEAARSEGASRGRRPFQGLEARRGDVLARMGRREEAVAAFRTELAAYPQNLEAYANLAVVLALLERPQAEVRGVLEQMQRANPGPVSAGVAGRVLAFVGQR